MRPLKLRAVRRDDGAALGDAAAIAGAGAAGAGQQRGAGIDQRRSTPSASACAASRTLAGATSRCTSAATRRPREHPRRGAQVVELGAGAGADVGDVDRRGRELVHAPRRWPGCAAARPAAPARRRRSTMAGAGRVVVAVPRRDVDVRRAVRGQPGARGLVRRDQAGLRAELGAHVGQRHALGHRQRTHGAAAELHRLVRAAVHAVAAEHRQHHVLGAHAVGEPAVPLHEDRLAAPAARSRR